MKNRKYYTYPIILILIVLVLSLFKIHGSSIGTYNERFWGKTNTPDIIVGEPRAVRSDEYIVGTPHLISQDRKNEPIINESIGTGVNFGATYDKPTRTIFNLFKPSQLIFFTSNNLEFNFAFHWWIRYAIMAISLYLLALKITKKNLFLSISFSLLFLFTPFLQWWSPTELITFISFSIFFFISIVDSKNLKQTILYSLGFTYSLISFGLILYPAFQVPLAWVALFFCLGYLISKRCIVLKRKNLLRISISVLLSIAIVLFVGYLFYQEFYEVISVTMNTTYPGQRFISAGEGSLKWLFNGFLNVLLQKTANTLPDWMLNQSEASNFFLISTFFVPWILYKNIISFSKKKVLDWLSISLVLLLIFFFSWYLLPLPNYISRYSLLYMVLTQRIFIGIGVASYLLILTFLNSSIYKFEKENKWDIILLVVICLVSLVSIYLLHTDIFIENLYFFRYPLFMPPVIKLFGSILIVPALVFLVIRGYRKLFLLVLLSYAFFSVFLIHPLHRGLDLITNTRISRAIQERNESRWIVYANYVWAQYIVANGGNALNGTHPYPLFEMWNVLDPEREYLGIYNRYANINVSTYKEGDDLVVLDQNDAITINIDPCDRKLVQLHVEYILSDEVLDVNCATLEDKITYPWIIFYIYKINE
jgi:hypothetical protein